MGQVMVWEVQAAAAGVRVGLTSTTVQQTSHGPVPSRRGGVQPRRHSLARPGVWPVSRYRGTGGQGARGRRPQGGREGSKGARGVRHAAEKRPGQHLPYAPQSFLVAWMTFSRRNSFASWASAMRASISAGSERLRLACSAQVAVQMWLYSMRATQPTEF